MRKADKNFLENLGFEITDAQEELTKIIQKEKQSVDNIGVSQADFTGATQTYQNVVEGLENLYKQLNDAYHEIQSILNEAP